MKYFLTTILLFLSLFTFSQTNFKWDKIDSCSKTKSQIYSDTKMFISETWKSSKDVIQNDDKDGGMILIKGMTHINIKQGISPLTVYWYSYNIKFFMKDNKYKIIVSDVSCNDAICTNNSGSSHWPLITACDNCEYPGYWKCSLKEPNYNLLLSTLKQNLQDIVDSYEKTIKSQSQNSNDGF